jgi:hypothetical protein
MAILTSPAKCNGPGCGGNGVRVPAGVGRSALACRMCDNPQLITEPLLPRPTGGYDRSHFEGTG